jgi:riboflavin biosynthesis pyrimidine reductase
MNKPYIICHMASTVDGRIIAESWGAQHKEFSKIYEACHNSFESEAWMVGRVTMEQNFTEGLSPQPIQPEKPMERTAFIADPNATSFAIAVDPKGKLGWNRSEIEGDHIIEVLTEAVSDGYLQYLQHVGISYIFGGKDTIDFRVILQQLYALFRIRTLMLEGGGHINGSLLRAGLIDELSLLVLPLADGTPNTPATFEIGEQLQKHSATKLKLKNVKRLESDVIWLKYAISSASGS